MPLRRPQGGWRGLITAAEALTALSFTQAALRFFRFQTVRRALKSAGSIGRLIHRSPIDAGTLLWAVGAAGRRCPIRKTCLGEALVAEALFHLYGYDPVLCIGAKRREGHFEAHAWLEQDNTVIVGGPAAVVEQYTRFPEIGSLTL